MYGCLICGIKKGEFHSVSTFKKPQKHEKNWHIFIKKNNILEGFPNLIKLYNFVIRKNSIRIVTRGNKAPSIKYLHP